MKKLYITDKDIFQKLILSGIKAQIVTDPSLADIAIIGEEQKVPSGVKAYVLCGHKDRNTGRISSLEEIKEEIETSDNLEELAYKTIFENTGTATLIVNEDMTIHRVNDELVRLTGIKREEIEGRMRWTDFVHPEDLIRMRAYSENRRAGKGEAPATYTFRLLGKGGVVYTVIVHVSMLPGTQKAVASLLDITELKRAREELEISRERYRELFQNARDGMMVTEGSKVVEVNRAFCEIIGMKKDEFLGQNAFTLAKKFVNVRELPTMLSVLRKYIAGKEIQPFDYYMDGKILQISSPGGMTKTGLKTAIFRNITAEREALIALKRSEEKYHRLVEYAPTGIISISRDGTILDVNRKLLEILGSPSREETMKINLLTFPPLVKTGVSSSFLRCLEDGRPYVFEHPYISKWGKTTYLRYHLTPLRNEMGETTGVIANVEDFTEYRRALLDLQSSEELYRTLVETTKLGISLGTLSGEIIFVNGEKASMMGFDTPEEMTGRNALEFIPEQDREKGEQFRKELLETGSIGSAEMKIKRRDGSLFDAEISASIVKDAEGRPFRVLEVLRDISDRKKREKERQKLESQLRQSQKMESIGLLAGGVAHDFNNLLTPILGYTELLIERIDEPARSQIEIIANAAKRAKELTWQLLAFGRKQVLSMKVYPLSEIVHDFLKMMKRTIRENIEIDHELGAEALYIRADRHQIEQVLMNLAVNAQEAIEGAGRIVITLSREEDYKPSLPDEDIEPSESYVRLTFSDSGKGMKPELIKNIFEPFFTTKEQGTGLGLSTLYGIVRQHSGFVEVDSIEGSGTTFHIFFPEVEGENVKRKKTDTQIIRNIKEKTVLVVDDSQLVLDMLPVLLKRLGLTPITAGTPKEAIDIVQTGRGIDILLTDVIMPGMNGRELSKRLTEIDPDIVTVYMSGYSGDILVSQGVLDPGTKYLQKPFSIEELSHIVGKII